MNTLNTYRSQSRAVAYATGKLLPYILRARDGDGNLIYSVFHS